MKHVSFSRALTSLCGTALAGFFAFSAAAEEGIGPMSAVGSSAQRRAVAPSRVASEGSAPEVAAAKEGEGGSSAQDSRVVGEIAAVKVYGSTEFAERVGLAEKILEQIGGGVKTVGEVSTALAAVRQSLMKDGYYLVRITFARTGAYEAETKTLSLVVDEGRFGRLALTFEGREDGTWFSREQMLDRFESLQEGDTFDYNKLRTALFDVNAHPDLIVDTSIDIRKPMPIEGEGNDRRAARYADMNLDVRESFPLHMVLEVNNYGMEEIEEWQSSLTLQYLNLTKHDDVLTVSPSMSFGAELKSIAASYMLPHNYLLGGATTLYGGYSTLDVDNVVPLLDLEGSGYFTGLQHTENLYDTDRHLFALSAGVLLRHLEDQYTALGFKQDERSTTILPASLALCYTGKKADFLGGRNFATVQGVYNVATFGDDLDELWTNSDEHYWIARWQLARLQPLFGWYDEKTKQDLHQWMLFFKLEGQYTANTLIPVEKMAMGGYNCLRGYHARGYLGDYGVYGTTELRTPILVDTFASLFGDRTGKTALDRLQFLGFVDYGWTAYNDLPAGTDDSEFIYSAGVGVRTAVTKYTQLRCDLAFPLRDTDWAKDDSMEIYISAQVQF